jgi:hypothetical protein
MNMAAHHRTMRVSVAAALTVAMSAGAAAGQSLGPVTGSVGTTDPTDVSFRIGPLMIATGLSVQRIGVDKNVFDEPEDPKRDWHAVITPDMTMFLRTGLVRFTLASTADFTYYHTYKSERGMNRTLRGRTELLLSRFRPFIAGATVQTRERPNAEIDLRAQRSEREMVGGLNFELSPLTFVFAGVTRTDYLFSEGEVYRGVALSEQLDRREESAAVGVRTDLTPLTSLQVTGRMSRDRFVDNVERDSDTVAVETTFTFAPDALFRGELSAGYQVFEPRDSSVETYRGMTLGGRILWPLFTATRLDIDVDRRVRYSYEEAEAYYVDTGVGLTLTQRVFRRIDVQGGAGYRWLEYGRTSVPIDIDPRDRVLSVLAGVGYTLRDESRVGFNYEFTKRESDRRPDRLFDRHRIFGSWTYQF